ncbi:hypothetical protein BKA56DRAFT_589745 [Ilyonectria sp. MPI-CAGE-AT-0026]|nr:hypothetical protein BKA56DRAFT_589745 [Ilyonectria sp. MPI-CAGE-AT-0026]
MYERCKQLKVQFAFGSEVTSVSVDEASQRFKSVELQELGCSSRTVPCQTLVIAAGPWSDRVFSRLFPLAKTSLPFDIAGSAGNRFRVRTPGWKPSDDEKGSEQVFLDSVIPGNHSLDITSFPGGTLYIGGYGAIPEPLPEYADFVKPQPTQIEAMLELTRRYLGLPPDEVLEILDLGRAYRPRAVPNHPIITKVDWGFLSIEGSTNNPFESQLPIATSDKPSAGCASIVGGLFINTGHHSDGLTLSLGSGKVMGELLLGQEPSVDISGLGLPQN